MNLKNEIRKDRNGDDIHIVFRMGGFDKDVLCGYAHRLVEKKFKFFTPSSKLVNIYDEIGNKIYGVGGSFIVFTKQDLDRIISNTVFDVNRMLKKIEDRESKIASIKAFRN